MSNYFDLVVVGGGFTGACLTYHVAKGASKRLRIAIIEPRATLGEGYAYQSPDAEHRLNGPANAHSIDTRDPDHLQRWCEATGLIERDPEAVTDKGLVIRRTDFARYINDQVHLAATTRADIEVSHIRDTVSKVDLPDQPGIPSAIYLESRSTPLHARCVALATGSPPPQTPRFLESVHNHPALAASPWDLDHLRQVKRDASVVVIGVSLTAADILAGFLSRGHSGPLLAFSRRGLLPPPFPEPDPNAVPLPDDSFANRIKADPPAWLTAALNEPVSLRRITKALRTQIKHRMARNEPWEPAFDAVRNAVWRFWPALPAADKRQFLRHLRPWYDANRFRMAPRAAQAVATAQRSGQLRILRGRLQAITPAVSEPHRISLTLAGPAVSADDTTLVADAVINCTGFDMSAPVPPDSMLGRLLTDGHLTRHPSGLGFEVSDQGTALNSLGQVQQNLRLFGPPSAGHWGDPLGVIFIALQIERQVPHLLSFLESELTHDSLHEKG